jgi:hypothetical protein
MVSRFQGSNGAPLRFFPTRRRAFGWNPAGYPRVHGTAGRGTMPRYFFHIKDKAKTMLDQEGIELDDLNEVRKKATQGANRIMREQVRLGRPRDDQLFVVTDEHGQTVLTFPFKLAIRD